MSIDRNRIKQIEDRWRSDRKIASADVDWLIGLAKLAQAAEVRDSLGPRDSLFDKLFGRSL